MPTLQRALRGGGQSPEVAQPWRDRKRYVWLLGLVVPTLVPMSALAAGLTGWSVFWWSGPILMFLVIPTLDYLVGPDAENPPEWPNTT